MTLGFNKHALTAHGFIMPSCPSRKITANRQLKMPKRKNGVKQGKHPPEQWHLAWPHDPGVI